MVIFIGLGLLFLSIILVVIAVFSMRNSTPVSLVERLKRAEQSKEAGGGIQLRDEEVMKKSLVERAILPFAAKFGQTFGRITPSRMIQSADRLILNAGMTGKLTGIQLVTISWLLAGVLALTFGALAYLYVQSGKATMGKAVGACLLAVVLGYRLPIGIVASRAKKRMHEIQISLAFTFDLISISVEAGMAFDGAMATVAERTKGALTDELRRTLKEINLGISREEALNNLAIRTGVEDLRSFITAVNYISRLGGSLVDVIKIQTDSMRVKRRQRAEEKANQAPVKMMIPLVIFILPCVFLVILGPVFLEASKML
jgi:tight adherence protein C